MCGGGISSCALNRSTDIACIRCIQCVYHSTKNYAGGISGIWASAHRVRCAKTCKNTPVRLGPVHPRPVYSGTELCELYTALICFTHITGTEFAMWTAGQSNLQVCAHLQRSATDSITFESFHSVSSARRCHRFSRYTKQCRKAAVNETWLDRRR